ncbi:capsule biosynthesis GfcC family protein [Pseudomonas helleri]|uniref:capsule biosynthesis GfcC family protein n=1 Tax=Pseudomonas helleri TaxID=1608996 RepID=UPI003FD3CAF6
MIRIKKILICLLLSHSALTHAGITVTGDVLKPGDIAFTEGMRFQDAIDKAIPNPQSYWLAAAWLHQPLLEEQTRLKVGVLFDLKMLLRGSLLNNNPDLAALAERLIKDVDRRPVTGRKVAQLDPVAIEVGFARNYLLSDGDHLIYPVRPNSVTVVGAVKQKCTLPYQAMKETREYLASCPRLAEAETDFLWLINPNGTYRRIAIAAWNRQDGIYAAAGSTILVPVDNNNSDLPTPDLNEQLAQFLATQPLAEVAP